MSLHQKIVWLFIGVAIVPLLVFAVLAREQSLALADFAAEADLMGEAAGVGRALNREAEEARTTLTGLAGLPPEVFDATFLEHLLGSGAGPQPRGLQTLSVTDTAGNTLAEAGTLPRPERCEVSRYTTLIEVTVPLRSGTGHLVGRYWAAGDPVIGAGEDFWVFDGDGEVVASSECGLPPQIPFGVLSPDSVTGLVPIRDLDAPDRKMVFARVQGRDWVVVTAGTSLLTGPLSRFFRNYWMFLLALALAAVLAFSVLLRRVTAGISDLTRAVESVAAGEMRPWLPTPGNDEIGRLTLAFSDMTDRLRETMDQVDRTGRLAVLGKLSAYLAHEIRNPLSSVKMNLQRLQRWHRQGEIPDRCGNAIEVSLGEVGRLSSAVSNILQLSPGRTGQTAVISVHEVLREAVELLARDLERAEIAVHWDLDAASDRVIGNPGQLKGVFINLLLNALDAQPQGGNVFLSSSVRPGTAGGARVELRFRDSGPGVPADVAARIFDPFFTTKDVGSGIGLAVAGQAVRDHGGMLYLAERHRLDEGAEFVVSLPLAPAAPEGEPEGPRPSLAPWMGDVAED